MGIGLRRLDTVLAPTPAPDRAFWRLFIERHMHDETTMAWMITSHLTIPGYCQHSAYSPNDLREWGGRMLLVYSESDLPMIRDSQTELRRLYPMVQA